MVGTVMFRSSTLVVAAVLGAGSASVAGCERGMLGGGGGAGQVGGHPGPLGIGNGGGTGAGGLTGAGGGMNCGAIDRPAPRAGLDVLVVLTASASMDWDATNQSCPGGCGATSKWAQATAAINEVVSQTQSTVGWGLKLVPEDRAGLCTVVPGLTHVVLLGDASSMAAVLAGRTSANGGLSDGGNNATRAAVEAAASHLSTLTDDDRRVIVLVTDGAPNCPPADAGAVDDTDLAVQAIAEANGMGFPTFVIGFAPTAAADVPLERMAFAGGRTTPPGYYPVASTSDLTATLRTVVADSARCVFAIPPPPYDDGSLTRWNILVSIDGVPVPYDYNHANGWDRTDDSARHLQLYGPVCDRALAASEPGVTVTFLCGQL
jgi:hypothetical protein